MDANVLISGLIFHGNENKLLDLGEAGEFEVTLSPLLLEEVRRTLQRKFDRSASEADEQVRRIQGWVEVREPTVEVVGVARDPNDNHVLACCLACQADYLVTGDRDLLSLGTFRGTAIVTGAQFLRLYQGPAARSG